MDEKIKKALAKEVQDDQFVLAIKNKCKRLVRMSASEMSQYYERWDEQQRVWEAERAADEEDRKSRKKNQPIKMVAPLSYAQTMTFIAVVLMLYRQKERFFELAPVGEEDHQYVEVSEILLQQDLNYNKFDLLMFQFLLYLCRCDVAIFETSWVRQQQVVPVMVEDIPDVEDGVSVGTTVERRRVDKYVGNEIRVVSPYAFFPDVRVAMERLNEGEFCASEEELGKAYLEQLESEGTVAGIDHVGNFSREDAEWRRNTKSRLSTLKLDALDSQDTVTNTVLVTKVQIKIIPSKFELDDGTTLGPEDFPIKYLVWIANDSRVIRLEPMDYVHDNFTYSVARFTPDDHTLLSKSLTEMVERLQEAYDWFVNTRVQSVRRTLVNQLVVDPSGIEMSTVNDRSPVILTKRGIGNRGIDQYLKQLNVTDVTATHLNDAQVMQSLMQIASGVNDNAMGQYHGGRRSAREAGVVAQSAGARIRMVANLIATMALVPLGEMMLTNQRSLLPRSRFDKVLKPTEDGSTEAIWSGFHPDEVTDLVPSSDFFVFDVTLPSEKGFMAQALQEILGMLLSNPQASAQFDLSPKLILDEIMELNGSKKGKRFSYFNDPQQLQQLIQQAFMAGQQTAMQQVPVENQQGPIQ